LGIALTSLRAGGVPYIVGKLDNGYNFSLKLTLIEGLHTKLCTPPKSWEFQFREFWESRNKMTFGCRPRGQAHSILQGRRWWIPPSPCHGEFYESILAPWFIHAPKTFQLYTNQFVVWFVHVRMIIDMLITHPSPMPKLQHALLPLKCRELDNTP